MLGPPAFHTLLIPDDTVDRRFEGPYKDPPSGPRHFRVSVRISGPRTPNFSCSSDLSISKGRGV